MSATSARRLATDSAARLSDIDPRATRDDGATVAIAMWI
jgi:hypothetical protein